MIKEREANSWKSVSYAKSISGAQTYTKFPIVLRTTEQSIPTWSVKGNMVQSGTPTPTSPITPQECGERTTQLFDGVWEQGGINMDGTFTDSTNPNHYKRIRSNYRRIEPLSDYTISTKSNNIRIFSICLYNANKEEVSFILLRDDIISSYTLTSTDDSYYIAVCFAKNNYVTQDISPSEAGNLTLNSGSTALPYEPYGYKLPIVSGNTTTNIYLSEPLRKIGDYADTIAADGTVTRRIKKIVFDGTEPSWTKSVRDDPTSYLYHINITTINYGVGEIEEIMCTHEPYSTDYPGGNTQGCTFKMYQNEYKIFYINLGSDIINAQTSGNTVEGLKEYLAQQYSAGTPVTVWYVLATPTTETTTTSAIPTTSGLNTIDVNTTLKPSEMSLTYDGYKLCKRQRYSRTENLLPDAFEQGGIGSTTGEDMPSTDSYYTIRVRTSGYVTLSSGTYTFSSTAYQVWYYIYSTSGVFETASTGWKNSDTFTIDSTKRVRFAVRKSDNSELLISNYTDDVMLNTGSTAKPYQPYLDWE